MPRIRFLIADDPGAGKTIMAGLVLKELKLRHLARHILIVVPGHLKDQWRREMKERFEETFVVIDRGILYTIQDPAANLQPEEQVEVRHLVGVKEIIGSGKRELLPYPS